MFTECDDCFVNYRCPIFNCKEPSPFKINCPHIFKIKSSLRDAGVPVKYQKLLFKDFAIHGYTPETAKILKTLMRLFSESINQEEDIYMNGIISGASGIGKSLFGAILVNEFTVKRYGKYKFDVPVAMYTDFSILMKRIKDNIDHPDEDLHRFLYNIRNTQLLVIDDVGAIRHTGYVQDESFVIFNDRYLNDRSTVVVSNYDKAVLSQPDVLSLRVVSRLQENGFLIYFDGNDRRV